MIAMNQTLPSMTERLACMTPSQLRGMLGHDLRNAAVWIAATAHEGIAAAQLSYGRMLLDGNGVARDSAAALQWFRRAADGGDLDAINMVGRCLENGWGATANGAEAAVWYRRAAEGRHAWAQYNLAHLYLNGIGVERDTTQAFALYQRAAEQGHERAMNLLGRCHEEGLGTRPDFAAAAHWYRCSAEGGYFRGQFNWATLLLKAGHVQEAANWLERSANGGNQPVRLAVLALITTCPHQPLQALANRLQPRLEAQAA